MQILYPPNDSVYLSEKGRKMGEYEPSKISGLVLWLNANDLDGVYTNGASISSWTDRSTYRHVASQSTSANQPVFYKDVWNGNSLVFAASASSRYMTIPRHTAWESNNITIISTFIPYGINLGGKILSRPYSTSGWSSPYASWCMGHTQGTTGRPEFVVATGASTYKDAYMDLVTANGLSLVIYTAIYDGTANAILRCNGTNRAVTYAAGAAATGNILYTNQTNLTLFARSEYSLGEYTNAYVGDILVYNRALNVEEYSKVEQYLQFKYGIIFA